MSSLFNTESANALVAAVPSNATEHKPSFRGIWVGTGSIPAAQDLIDACTPANLVISSKAGGVMSAVEHFNGVLAGTGLQIVNEM